MLNEVEYLVLSGSGDKFCVELGACKSLFYNIPKIKLKGLVGTSGGAIVTSTLALGYSYHDTCNFLRTLDIPNLLDFYWSKPLSLFQEDKLALMKGEKIYNKLKEFFNVKFKDTKIPLAICTTDLQTKGLKIFGTIETPDVYIYDALRASISLPFIFTPHTIDGVKYIDGGISENFYLKYYSKDTKNIVGIRMVDKPTLKQASTIQDLIMDTVFIPIVQNEEKNIEDSPNSTVFNIYTESDNYDFKKLTYKYMLEMVNYGEQELNKQLFALRNKK